MTPTHRFIPAVMALALLWSGVAFAQDPEPEPTTEPAPCVDPGLEFDTVVEALAKDSQAKSMKPWELKSIVVAPCSTTLPEIEVSLTYWTPETQSKKLKIIYQLVLSLPFHIDDNKLSKQKPALSKVRGTLTNSIIAAEKDDLVQDARAAVEEMGAEVFGDGSIHFLVPSWGETPVVVWDGKRVTKLRGRSGAEYRSAKIQGFLASVGTIVDGKTCATPETFDVEIDHDNEVWIFRFELPKPCKGNWRMNLGFDGDVNVTKE